MPNQDQLLSVLRWVLTALGSFLTTNGTVSSSTWQQVSGVILTIAPLLWGMFVHTQSQTVLAAGAVPGVDPIRINSAAELALQRLAAAPNNPSVVPSSTMKH